MLSFSLQRCCCAQLYNAYRSDGRSGVTEELEINAEQNVAVLRVSSVAADSAGVSESAVVIDYKRVRYTLKTETYFLIFFLYSIKRRGKTIIVATSCNA